MSEVIRTWNFTEMDKARRVTEVWIECDVCHLRIYLPITESTNGKYIDPTPFNEHITTEHFSNPENSLP